MNDAVTRTDQRDRAAVRREWPLILFGGVVAAATVMSLVLQIANH